MKIEIILLPILLLSSFLSSGQKTVVITNSPQIVPIGKKWILPKNKEVLIEVSFGVLNTGSLCNARFYAPSSSIEGVVTGEYGRPNKVYAILFNSLKKEPYTNKYTFRINTKAFVSSSPTNPNQANEEQILFFAGEKAFTGNCLSSLQLIEVDLDKNDLQEIEERKRSRAQQKEIPAPRTKDQTFELDRVKQIPYINESSMKTIVLSIQKLFNEAIREPEKNSTIKAVSDTVYTYYDVNDDGLLDKVRSSIGKLYSQSDENDLKKNDRLLFNLTFDDHGNLDIPDRIYVISNREESVNRQNLIVGLFAFELNVTEDARTELSAVRLQNLAKFDDNSSRGLTPVKIKIPLYLSFGAPEVVETKGRVIKRGDQIEITSNDYIGDKDKLIETLKKQTNILEYKKGEFDFVIEKSSSYYYTDMNIFRGSVWSQQTQNFPIKSETVKSFLGQGKKVTK
ncbi:MAG: hypothetical protein IM618_16160 [Cytophagales bacterium]|nr:hypothetical protein [Cytophagales bacterium]